MVDFRYSSPDRSKAKLQLATQPVKESGLVPWPEVRACERKRLYLKHAQTSLAMAARIFTRHPQSSGARNRQAMMDIAAALILNL